MRAAIGAGMVDMIQLLVHAGAPTSRRDDDNYCELAKAYVRFHGIRSNTGLPLNYTDGELAAVERGSFEHATVHRPFPKLPEKVMVEDAQLAYIAVESQLLTSSLMVSQVTPSKSPTANDGEISPWPEDLEMHSPQKSDEHTKNSEKIKPTNNRSENFSPVLHGYSKKRRLIGNDFGVSNIRPFKPPVRQKAPSENLDSRRYRFSTPEKRPKSVQSERNTSYLKTPNLHCAVKESELSPEEIPERLKDLASAVYLPNTNESGLLVTEYRASIPENRQTDPYVLLAKLNRVDQELGGKNDCKNRFHQAHAGSQSRISSDENKSTSELPTTYAVSDLTVASPKPHLRVSCHSCSGPEPNRGSSPQHEQTVSARSEGRSGTQRPIGKSPLDETIGVKEQPFQRHPKIGDGTARSKCSRELRHDVDTSAQVSVIPELPLILIAPEPAASTSRFMTHITERLLLLSDESELSNHFNPVFMKREIQPLERGHWTFNPSKWAVCLQINFWRFLEKFIGQGHAGWGVFCIREPLEEPGLGSVQVFCWGEIVKHTYLLLYVASNSQVRRLGLKWIDAEGHAIVGMRSN